MALRAPSGWRRKTCSAASDALPPSRCGSGGVCFIDPFAARGTVDAGGADVDDARDRRRQRGEDVSQSVGVDGVNVGAGGAIVADGEEHDSGGVPPSDGATCQSVQRFGRRDVGLPVTVRMLPRISGSGIIASRERERVIAGGSPKLGDRSRDSRSQR